MNIIICCLVILIAASSDSKPKKCLNQHEPEDNFILWGSLFTKINTILNETTRLSESLVKLNKSFASNIELVKALSVILPETEFATDITKLLEFESKSRKQLSVTTYYNLLNYLDYNCLQFHFRQDAQELQFKIFIENTQKHFLDLKKGQELQERKLTNFTEQQSTNNDNAWTTILRRQDGSVDFYRNWTEYQQGFGNPDGEFFIGMEKLYAMTALVDPQELMVILKDFENETRIAKYDIFKIGNEREKYALTVLGSYSGDAGDALDHHKGMKFSTYDQDNDTLDVEICAKNWKGAWWFRRCYWSHLFGPYRSEKMATNSGVGWNTWKGQDYSLKFVEMKIRSISF